MVKTVCGQKHDGAFTGLGAGMDVYNGFEANIHLTGKEKDKKMKREGIEKKLSTVDRRSFLSSCFL